MPTTQKRRATATKSMAINTEPTKCIHLKKDDFTVLESPNGISIILFFNVTGITPNQGGASYYFDCLREYPATFYEPRLTMHVQIGEHARDIVVSFPPVAIQSLLAADTLILLPVPRPNGIITHEQILAYGEDYGTVAVDLTLEITQTMLVRAGTSILYELTKIQTELSSAVTDGYLH